MKIQLTLRGLGLLGLTGILCWIPLAAQAVPILQVGAPAGSGDTGTYADYEATLTGPTEEDTAVTSGSTLYAAGAYKKNNSELLIGGKYTGSECPSGGCKDWTGVNSSFNSSFNGKGAVIMVTVPDGSLSSVSITIGGNSPFYTTATFESGFVMPNPPSNHDPVKNQDYLFFDIGNFAKTLDNTDPLRLGGSGIPNLADETTSDQPGEIKTLNLSLSGADWYHFDLFALTTDTQGQTKIVTNLDGNPGSHDVTHKEDGNGGPPTGVPEPGILGLLGIGLLGMGATRWRRRTK